MQHGGSFQNRYQQPAQAEKLLDEIHRSFKSYSANFDLSDCDKILRIESACEPIESFQMLHFVHARGHHAEILPG